VAQITGALSSVRLFQIAFWTQRRDELTDLPPEELLQRLREGKVYVAEQAAHAIQRFFRHRT